MNSFKDKPASWVSLDKGVEAANKGDYVAAVAEWRPLAEQGLAEAQYNMGLMYDEGQGVSQDYKEAFKWYILSAEQGDVKAQYNLGVMHYNGKGVVQDYSEALKWWRLAAEQDRAEAQFNLGVMYHKGEGVTKNNLISHMWHSFAVLNGLKKSEEYRVKVTRNMTPEQIAEAQKLARDWREKNNQ